MSDDVSEPDAAEEALGHGHAAPAAEGDRSAPAMPPCHRHRTGRTISVGQVELQ
jgi:hypothetical protein